MAAIDSALLAASLGLAVVACGGESSAPAVGPAPAQPVEPPPEAIEEAAPAVPVRSERAAFASSAQRCGECHAYAVEQWEGSPHARSATSPLYRAIRGRTPEPERASCDRCHAPLAEWVPPGDPIAEEGVACDACHAARDVTIDGGAARIDLRLDDDVKYATLCDAEDHYFHRMGCSPLHGEGRFCAGCHHLERQVGGATLAIYGEYAEWRGGPSAAEDVDCQFCHMPEQHGEVATGSAARDVLSHHGFFGSEGDLRARAIEIAVRARADGEARIALEIDVRNRRAGHPIPAGMPGRAIRVRAIARSAEGAEQARAHTDLARVLGCASGAECFHHEADRVLRDDRIAPRETRTIALALEAPQAGEIAIEVAWRELGDGLAAIAGVEPREEILARASIAIGAPSARRRVGRPRIGGGAP